MVLSLQRVVRNKKDRLKLPTKTAGVNAQKKLGKNQSDSDSDFEDNLTLSEIAKHYKDRVI